MRNRVARRWLDKPWFAALLLAAFFSRALIPVGFMPGPGGLIICNGYAPITAAAVSQTMAQDMSAMDLSGMAMSGMDSSGTDVSQHSGHGTNEGGSPNHAGSSICPFAAAGATMASSPTVVLVNVAHTVTHQIDLPYQAVIPRDTVAPTRLPRGPPRIA